MTDVALYHWSPIERRASIKRRGLVPGSLSTDRSWRPGVVCLADSPSLAWGLSGMTTRGRQHTSWDLWMVWLSRIAAYDTVPFDDESTRVKEYRVYDRIYKRDLWYVATRSNVDSP